MGLNQRISLVLSAEDKTGAAFQAIMRGFSSLGVGANTASQQLTKQVAAVRALSIAQADYKVKGDAVKLANDNISLAMQKTQVIQLQYADTMTKLNALQAKGVDVTTQMAAANLKLAQSVNLVSDAENKRNASNVSQSRSGAGVKTAETNLAALAPTSLLRTGATVVGGAVVAAGAYGAYKAVRAGSAFTSQEAQLAAQTGASAADVARTGQSILQYTAGGKSLYSQQQLLQGALVPYNLQQAGDIPKGLLPQIIPLEAQASAVVRSPNLDSINQALVAQVGFAGKRGKTTIADIRGYLNADVAAEQATPNVAGAVIAALPSLFAGVQGTGVSGNDALALQTELTNTGISPQKASTWIGQMLRSSVTRPTPQATQTAQKLGLQDVFGPQAFRAEGSNIFTYLSNLSSNITGPRREEIIQQLFGGGLGGGGILAAKAFTNLTTGNNLSAAAGFSDQFSASQGVVGSANNQLLQGYQQQEIALTNRFNSELTQMGNSINQVVLPALIGFATGLLDSANKSGNWLDNADKALEQWLGSKGYYDKSGTAKIVDAGKNFLSYAVNGFRSTDSATAAQLVGGGAGAVTPIKRAASTLGQQYTVSGVYSASWYAEMGIPLNGENQVGHPPGQPAGYSAPFTIGPGGKHYAATGQFGDHIGGPVTLQDAQSQFAEGVIGKTSSVGIAALTAAQVARQNKINDAYFSSKNDTNAFQTNYTNYRNQVNGINSGQNNLSTEALSNLRKGLLKELGTLSVSEGLSPAVKASDTNYINSSFQKIINDRRLNAANIEYSNAVANQQNVQQSTDNLSQNMAAATDVYNKQLALIAAEQKTGQLKKTDANAAGTLALVAYNKSTVQALQAPLAEAQSRVSLTQATGIGIPAAVAEMVKLLDKEFAAGGIGKNALALEKYQLAQISGSKITPGPQLVRPNGVDDSLTASFTSSGSRLSAARVSNNAERQLAAAEQTIQYLQQQLTIDEQELVEIRGVREGIQGINAKLTPVAKQSSGKGGVDLSGIRAPIS